jgi:hypothetical protein
LEGEEEETEDGADELGEKGEDDGGVEGGLGSVGGVEVGVFEAEWTGCYIF